MKHPGCCFNNLTLVKTQDLGEQAKKMNILLSSHVLMSMKTTPTISRNELLTLRPDIPIIDHEIVSNPAEKFQNETLRPILKFQNDLLVAVYRRYIEERKSLLFNLPKHKQAGYIEDSLKKDQGLRNMMLGMIIGLFSEEEYIEYAAEKRELSKRAISMLITRLQDQILKRKD
jgi:hypothetical protein